MPLTQITRSRFEITQDGQTAWLEFETDCHGWLTLWHTEVPRVTIRTPYSF